jgi:mono/diheme cytochrome c family protein
VSLLAALSLTRAILVGVASGLVVVLAAVAAAVGVRRPRRPRLDIPPAMRPGPSDPDLEKPILEKLQVWGMLLIVGMAMSMAAVWLLEPRTNANDARLMLAQSIERGRLTTMPGSEENQLGFNCERCHGPGLHGGQNFYNGAFVPVPNLRTVCARLTIDQIVQTIAQGRPGTDMPSWSVKFAGAMDDQQINDVVNYILSIQEVPPTKSLCLHPELASPAAGGASPTPAAAGGSPSPAPSPSP